MTGIKYTIYNFRERKEIEAKEEDIVESLREVQFRITELLKRNRRERETTE